jgi:hypothetical protein
VCDRIFRFTPVFNNRDEAATFVDEQAQAWLANQDRSATSSMERAHG